MTASKTSTRKAKGRGFQQDVKAAVCRELGISETDVKSTIMGEAGADLWLSSQAKSLFPFAVECKRQESIKIWAALQQAQINAEKVQLKPLLVFKRNRGNAYCCLRFDDFLGLVKQAYKKK